MAGRQAGRNKRGKLTDRLTKVKVGDWMAGGGHVTSTGNKGEEVEWVAGRYEAGVMVGGRREGED